MVERAVSVKKENKVQIPKKEIKVSLQIRQGLEELLKNKGEFSIFERDVSFRSNGSTEAGTRIRYPGLIFSENGIVIETTDFENPIGLHKEGVGYTYLDPDAHPHKFFPVRSRKEAYGTTLDKIGELDIELCIKRGKRQQKWVTVKPDGQIESVSTFRNGIYYPGLSTRPPSIDFNDEQKEELLKEINRTCSKLRRFFTPLPQ